MQGQKLAAGNTSTGMQWKIAYQVSGEGHDVILLHGGGPGATGASNYSKNIEVLSRNFRCWVIDFPGWGGSSKNLNAFGGISPFHNGGRAVAAFMDEMGLKKAHLIGNSFGGAAALCLAMDAPMRVDRMILMGPAGGVVPNQTAPTEGIRQLLTYYLNEGPTQQKLENFLRNMVYDPSFLTPEIIEQRFELSNDPEVRANPPLVLTSGGLSKDIFISQDPRLSSLSHRALFVWGMNDKVNLVEGAESFRVMPNADYLYLSKCGHWAQWERSEIFNWVAVDYLKY